MNLIDIRVIKVYQEVRCRYMKKIGFKSSISIKITFMTLTAIVVAIIVLGAIMYSSVRTLNDNTLEIIEDEVLDLSHEYYGNYIESIEENIKNYIEGVNKELLILKQLTEEFIYSEEFENVDIENLIFSEDWYQNEDSESTAVFVQGYLLDNDNKIKEEPLKLLQSTKFLNHVLPSFSDNGFEKIQVYFQGGKEREIVRMAPWSNIGENVFSVYPELNDVPIWDTFNPGLIEDWEHKKQINGEENIDYGRVTAPVQDGVTGEIVLTYTQPIFEKNQNKVKGVVSTDVSIEEIVSEIEKVKLGSNGFAFLMQSNGNVFALADRGAEILGLGNVSDSTINRDEGYSILERYISQSEYYSVKELYSEILKENREITLEINGERYIVFKEPMKIYRSWTSNDGFFDEYWYLSFVIPEKELYSVYFKTEEEAMTQMNDAITKLSVYMAMIIITLILAIIAYNTKITSGLRKLVIATDDIRNKNYEINLNVKSSDEIGQLANAFESMANEIKLNFQKMSEQNEILVREIDKRKKREQKIDYLENFDVATNLPNKAALINYLNESSKDGKSGETLVVIGIDEFRKINEGYGYVIGDELIKKVSNRLKNSDYGQILFKLKGDEFGLVLKSENFSELIDIIQKIRLELMEPYQVKDRYLTITTSMGVSSFPYDTDNISDLYKFALTAMSHTKEVNKGGYEFYSKDMNIRARNRLEMIASLDQAIAESEFSLVYQPIVDLESEKWEGVETLIRWNHPSQGLIRPDEFIPLAEETKKIIEIGKWVLIKSLEDLKRLHDSGFWIDLSVNVSVVQLVEKSFIDDLMDIVKKSKIPPQCIHLEVTESSFIEDKNAVKEILNRLKEYGLSILIDDFGTGYSSLSYLKDLPISKLKIDKGFVIDLDVKENQEIVNTIIGLSQNLKFGLIAEGIETKEQRQYLLDHGCKLGQGYYYSKPVDIETIEEMLKK
jgi:diguanylate cyclase (GGDEF)-like protein